MGCTTWAGRWIFLGGDLQQRHPWVGDCRSRRLCISRKLVRHWIGTNAAIYVDPLTIRRWKNFSPGVSDVVLGAEIIPWRVWCCNQWPIPAKYETCFKTSLRYLSTSLMSDISFSELATLKCNRPITRVTILLQELLMHALSCCYLANASWIIN